MVDNLEQTDLPINGLEHKKGPEDEFVKAVTNMCITGKFPQGLVLNNIELQKPQQSWYSDFTTYSPLNKHFHFNDGYNLIDLVRGSYPGDKPFPNSGVMMILPDPKDSDKSVIVFSFLQNGAVRDGFGRHALSAQVSFQMQSETARKFIKLIKDNPEGADITESFLNKAAPGVMARSSKDKGIWRDEVTDLFVFDEEAQVVIAKNQKANFKSYVSTQLTRKFYTKPIGFKN